MFNHLFHIAILSDMNGRKEMAILSSGQLISGILRKNMIRCLKQQKRLTSKSLQTLLVPTVTQLDMEDVYLTKKILSTIWTQCPNLVAISLKGCGYLITDNVLNQFVQNLPKLERLNLCSCTHLTSKCLSILSKWLVHLQVLHITSVPSLTFSSVQNFLQSASELKFVDVFYLKTTSEQYTALMETAKRKEIKIILRDPKKKILEGQSECDFGPPDSA
ncbi:unnamed protein product [Lymnaea stagnalis]|uniref:Uncharacterized protein n=1 Tax=Lymnaea stagnalis TaxID=6523 RepID=A0AAV2HQ03_LYMST